jgi:acetyltransferase-like isoleucine patch superfamily enzyme
MTVLAHDWWPAEVPENVAVDESSWLYSSFAFIHHRSRREPSVRIAPNSWVFNCAHFDLGPDGELEIGEYCNIGGVVICSNGRVEIGDYSFVGSESVIADDFAPFPFDSVDEPGSPGPDTTIGDACWVGRRSLLLGGVTLGDGVIVGAGAVVDFDVPDYAIVAGNPGRIVGSKPPRSTD